MKHISLPKKIEVNEIEKGTKSQIIIEPCFPGYGLTLGNALRRVLLSSLPGGAVTAVKIDGVSHEFSTMENLSEDIVDVVLNLKQLNVKIHADEPVILKLHAKGEGEVTGADIEASSDAEIINKDLRIATLNDKNAELKMELTVTKGIGYVPTEEQEKEKPEIGLILVDSIFTPVLNVGLQVKATRVGKETDYDKIILDVETDGTIAPDEAVLKAAEILSNQFNWVVAGGEEELEEVDLEKPTDGELAKDYNKVEEVEVVDTVETDTETINEDVDDEAEEKKPKKRGRPKKESSQGGPTSGGEEIVEESVE